MPRFSPPTLERFFDNRLIIVWVIKQPLGTPPLRDLEFRIHGDLEFTPNQENVVVLPSTGDGNEFLVNWVVRIPETKTEVELSVHHGSFMEKFNLVIDPHNLPP
ncbi:MAG: hypothetical protein ACFFE8_08710 [Candidatus Heimdallarchaeota archaeon]